MSRFFCYKDAYGFDQIYERHKSRGEMTFSIEGVVQNPCLLAPPPFPKDFLDTAALQRLNDYRDTFSAWKTYVGECMNGTGPTTAELTSTSVSLSPVSNLTTPYLTSTRDTDLASTPIPVTPQPRQPQTPPDTNDVIVIAIIVSVVILLLIVLVVVIIYKYRPIRKKICGQSTNRRPAPGLYDLDQHAQINYVNNKAERGEYWRDKDPENHSHRSSVGDPGGGGAERPHPQKINKVKPIHIRTDNNTATYHQHENTNGCHVTDINQSPLCKQKVIHDKCSEEPQKSAQKETIYANHQFEKIIQKKSKGHSNPTFTGDDSHKLKALPVPENLPPIDNRTNDMYIIDESPYDRVDFNAARAKVPSPRQSNSKPVPTKRKLKNQKPIYDENAESVDV